MPRPVSAMRGVPVNLQSLQTTGNGDVLAIPSSFTNHTLYIKGNGAVGAGAIQPEVAASYDYSGTWAPVGGGPITVPANATTVVTFTGVYQFIRARISTNVTVGTVTVDYVGS